MSIFQKIIGWFNREPERVSTEEGAKGLLWYPSAVIEPEGIKMKTRGTYRKGYPEGAVVHWTSGWNEGIPGRSASNFAISSAKYAVKSGMTYFLIDREGVVYQCFPLNRSGWHAGKSFWPSVGSSVSSYFVGIEVMADGTMKKSGDQWVSDFGHKVGRDSVRVSAKKDNIASGVYHKFTLKQEEALTDLLVWLHKNNPEIFKLDNVVGHDEVAPVRKVDPGGALSMTMPELRKHLKGLV